MSATYQVLDYDPFQQVPPGILDGPKGWSTDGTRKPKSTSENHSLASFPVAKKNKCYLIGSLRNSAVPDLAKRLRLSCPSMQIFDDWYAAGPEADDMWKDYEVDRGRTYAEALGGYAACHVFDFDKYHLDSCSHAVLVLPAGKSGHMEIMYAKYGAGAKTAIYLEPNKDIRYDVMYKFVDAVLETEQQLLEFLK